MTGPGWFNGLSLRGKLIVMVLPLAVVPTIVAGALVGYISSQEAYGGITRASRDDLAHMAEFTIDLLNSHRQQFEVYRKDKRAAIRSDLATLVDFAIGLVEAEENRRLQGGMALEEAKQLAAEAIRKISVGQTGYAYAMTGDGSLVAHIAREGENILDERDDSGRPFIREMCRLAKESKRGQVLHVVYPWRNALLGDVRPREKTVAYSYYAPWDWIIAVGSYLDETGEEEFEAESFEELKQRVKDKRVGSTGYVYALDRDGRAVIHPFREGELLIDEVDGDGNPFIRRMLESKDGWIRYPWRNPDETEARMKVVRYVHFEPWDWVVAVGSYENEFFSLADTINERLFGSMMVTTLGSAMAAFLLLLWAAKVFTDPVSRMTRVIRNFRGGGLDEKMEVDTADELGELASAYNSMIEVVAKHRAFEQELAQQGKMASLGMLSSTVAHEINNPLGVILGYSAFLEKKLDETDPNHQYVAHIKREAKRSKKIVQDLLSYSKVSGVQLAKVDINELLGQIVDFSSHHPATVGIRIRTDLDPNMPEIEVDGDQLRQVAMNLILNGADAIEVTGEVTVGTGLLEDGMAEITVTDTGRGISQMVQEKIFEPFFTTKTRGTGLGLAICGQIVKRHQGRIVVESEEGLGTRVRIIIPVVHKEF